MIGAARILQPREVDAAQAQREVAGPKLISDGAEPLHAPSMARDRGRCRAARTSRRGRRPTALDRAPAPDRGAAKSSVQKPNSKLRLSSPLAPRPGAGEVGGAEVEPLAVDDDGLHVHARAVLHRQAALHQRRGGDRRRRESGATATRRGGGAARRRASCRSANARRIEPIAVAAAPGRSTNSSLTLAVAIQTERRARRMPSRMTSRRARGPIEELHLEAHDGTDGAICRDAESRLSGAIMRRCGIAHLRRQLQSAARRAPAGVRLRAGDGAAARRPGVDGARPSSIRSTSSWRRSPIACAMCELAARLFGGRVEVSRIEEELGGESYTLRTVKALQARASRARIRAGDRRRPGGRARALARLARAEDAGRRSSSSGGRDSRTSGAALDLPPVSSTEVRARVARGETVDGWWTPAWSTTSASAGSTVSALDSSALERGRVGDGAGRARARRRAPGARRCAGAVARGGAAAAGRRGGAGGARRGDRARWRQQVMAALPRRRPILLHCAGALRGERAVRRRCAAPARRRRCCIRCARSPGAPTTPISRGTVFGVEGDEPGARGGAALVRAVGGAPLLLDGDALARYHAAAALVSNHAVGLVDAAGRAAAVASASPRAGDRARWRRCSRRRRATSTRVGLPDALTGPIARGDVAVVARHLLALAAASSPRSTAPPRAA